MPTLKYAENGVESLDFSPFSPCLWKEEFKIKYITQSCSKKLLSEVGLSDPPSSVIELIISNGSSTESV